ncbi:MAG: hypothetical protein ORN49_13900 [Rhodobacteraceae bacterium]|nr:hypothetical protein [Paracoccaceae bacterium]
MVFSVLPVWMVRRLCAALTNLAVLFLVFGTASAQSPADAGPEKVTVGTFVNDVQNVSLESHSYMVDFYVWMRWRDPSINPLLTMEFINPYQVWDHMTTMQEGKPIPMPDGSLYMFLRYQGQFNSKLPLERYPFDQQNLTVIFEDSVLDTSKLVYVPDRVPATLNPEMTLPGYLVGQPRLTIGNTPYDTNFGDIRDQIHPGYSEVTLTIPVHRPMLTYSIKVILPIFLVVASAALTFFIQPNYVEARIGMGITTLLTLVALQLTMNTQLPTVDYLMMVDMLYFVAYGFVVAAIAQVVRASWAASRQEAAAVVRQDRRTLTALAAIYLVSSGAIILRALLS